MALVNFVVFLVLKILDNLPFKFIENEAELLCKLCDDVQQYLQLQSCVQLFEIAFAKLQSSVFMGHFSNAFWHGNKEFPKGSS